MVLIRSFLVLVLFVSVLGCRGGKVLYRVSVNPDPRVADRLDPAKKAVVFEEGGVWGAIRPVSYEDLADPASLNRAWDFPNPFQGIYDEPGMPLVFYLMIENRSERGFTFNGTASFSLYFERAPLFSIDYEDFYQDLYDTRDGEARLTLIRKLLFRSYQTLKPGEQVRGLAFFRRPEAKKIESQELLFRIRRIYIGKDEIDFLVPFRLDMEEIASPEE